jgi:hypothetical protein
MDNINTGFFDDPMSLPEMEPVNTNTQFENPFEDVIPSSTVGKIPSSTTDPLGKSLDKVLSKGPSFGAVTAPQFFDWEGSNAERFTNSRYYQELGFNPNRDNETLFGHRQTWGDVMLNAFAGGGDLAWNTFWDSWKGWGRLTNALFSWNASKLMGSPEELEELNKEQNRIMNKYAIFKTPESEGSLFNRQFFGDMVQQSGFALGTIAQFASEELLTMGAASLFKPLTGARLFGGFMRGVKTGELTADAKRLTDVAWKGKTASKLYDGLKFMGKYTPVAGNLFDAGRDLWKTVKEGGGLVETLKEGGIWELGNITFNGLKRTMAEANMAFTESRMEAAGTYAELKARLMQESMNKSGTISADEEQRIEDMAQAGAWSNFRVNAATISIMNRLQFDNLFRKFSANKRAVREMVEDGEDIAEKINKVTGKSARDIAGEGGTIATKKGQPLTQVYDKGILGTFGNVRKIASDFGKETAAWEATKSVGRNLFKWEVSEGVQELIQEGSNNAIKDYYTDLYTTGKANRDKSVNVAIDSLTNVSGLKIFLMGAVTGRLLSPINKAFSFAGDKLLTDKGERKQTEIDRAVAIQNVNSFFADPSRYAPEAIANLKAQNRATQYMEDALANNDKYIYEHAKDSAFAKAVSSAKKLNMLESLTDTIRAYGDHFDEKQFGEAFAGVDFNDDKSRGTVKQYMNKVADEVEAFSDRYDKLKETYSDVIQPEKYTGKFREQAASVRRALDEVVEWIATNEYRAAKSASRGLAILQEASELPTVGQSAHMAFRILGDNDALENEMNLLDQEIASMEPAVKEEERVPVVEKGKEEPAAKEGENELVAKEDENKPPVTKEDKSVPIAKVNNEVSQRLELKKQQRGALEKLKGNLTLFEEGDADNLMDGLRDYIDSKNKEYGIETRAVSNTRMTPNDLEDLYFLLRDYRRLGKDEKNFMDAYAMLADRKKFAHVFMRIHEGLEHVQEEQKKQAPVSSAATDQIATTAIVNPEDEQEKERVSKVGTDIDEYHGFRVNDKITYQKGGKEQGPFDIERISNTRVELFNSKNNEKENLSLDRFDELIQENKVKRLAREGKFNAKLTNGKTLIDGKEGVYIVKVVENGNTYYVLTDAKERVLNDEGGFVNGNERVAKYVGKDEVEGEKLANEGRNKILSLREEQQKGEMKPYTFDGKQLKLDDILIKDDKRYQVKTSKEPETKDGKPFIRLQLLGGTDTNIITANSLEGYQHATEVAATRTKTKKAKANKFKLKVSDVLTNVRGVAKQGESQEVADKRLQEFTRSVTREDFLKNLVIKVSNNPNWRKGKEITHRENQNLQVRGDDIEIQLFYKNEVIGTLPHYAFYQYLDDNGKVVEMSRLTKEQFQQIFDVAPGDITQQLKEVQENYNQAKKAFNEFYTQISSKGNIELDEKAIRKLFKITLSAGDYDWAPKPSVPLKNLRYNGIEGKVVLIARRLARGVKNKLVSNERIITENALNDEQRQALLKRIDEQRLDQAKKDTTKNMGNYLAVVELPNKELRFVPLEMPAYGEKELDEVVKEINEQSKLTRETNITEAQGKKTKEVAKDNDFNDAFSATLAEKLMMSVSPGLEVSVSLNAFGNLEITFFDIDTKSHPTIRLTGKDAKSPLAYTNFKELLTDINKKIAEHDAKQTDLLQLIDLELEANDFKKHLSDKPDFTEIKNLHTLVTEQVVSGGFIKVTYNTDKNNTLEVLLPTTPPPISPRKRGNGQKAVEAGMIEQTQVPAAKSTTEVTAATGQPGQRNLRQLHPQQHNLRQRNLQLIKPEKK